MTAPDVATCIFTTSYPRYEDDEAAIFVGNYVLGLSRAGGRGIVLVPRDNDEAEIDTNGKFKIVRFKYGIFKKGSLAFGSGIMPNIKQNPLRALQAPALLLSFTLHALRHRKEFDIIHCNWAITALPGFLTFLITGKPYVITLRGEDVRLLRNFIFKLLLSIPFRFSKTVTSVNQSAVAELSSIYPFCSHKVRCIPNGVELAPLDTTALENFRNNQSYFEEGKVALFVGTLIPRKQVHILIEALSAAELSDWTLIIVGRLQDLVYVSSLQKLIEERSLTERVKLIGTIKPKDIAYYFASATVYVSASEHEGRPNSVLEAVTAGLPVILSNIEGHREITEQYGRGFLFDPADPLNLAIKLTEIDFKKLPAATVDTLIRSWKEAGIEYQNLFASVAE